MAPPMNLRVTFTAAEWAAIDKPVSGRFGGFQSLMAKILSSTNRDTFTVILTPRDVERATAMSKYISGGGYETRYSAIVQAVARGELIPF